MVGSGRGHGGQAEYPLLPSGGLTLGFPRPSEEPAAQNAGQPDYRRRQAAPPDAQELTRRRWPGRSREVQRRRVGA